MGPGEAVGDAGPCGSRGNTLDHEPWDPGGVCGMQLGIEGARDGLGVVGDEAHVGEAALAGNAGMGDDPALVRVKGQGVELACEVVLRLPFEDMEAGAGGVVTRELARASEGFMGGIRTAVRKLGTGRRYAAGAGDVVG